MHKFILGDNPRAPESGGLWVVHLPDPVAIMEVVHAGMPVHTPKATHTLSFGEFQLRLYHYFTTDIGLSDEQQEKKAHKMLKRAAHWYQSYLDWEDDNIDVDEYSKNN